MRKTALISLACVALIASSCATGWVDRQTKMRIRGKVIESGTGKPVAAAYIDMADNDEMLRLILHPKNTSGEDGTFDVTYIHDYDRNIFMFIPIGGEPAIPEKLLIEITKDGYAPTILAVDPQQLERDSHQAYVIEEVKLHKE